MGNGVLVQSLGVMLQPNTAYTLVFSVGSRADYVFAGYTVELLAGSTVLASDSSMSPPSGTFATGRIAYSSTNASPAILGQALGIRLTGNGKGQADFDKISLDATPTSFPVLLARLHQVVVGKTFTILNLSSTQNSIK